MRSEVVRGGPALNGQLGLSSVTLVSAASRGNSVRASLELLYGQVRQ